MTMSVPELEAGLESVRAAIEQQTDPKVLLELQHEKILLGRQLNAERDPVTKLPPEITSEIFIQCIPVSRHPQREARCIPILLLNICHSWSDVAVSTPQLWTGINIPFPRPKGSNEVLGTWLDRSRNHPFRVYMVGPLDPDEATLLWRHSERLSSFHFIIPTGQAPPFRLFHGMEPPESLPSLRVFSMYGRYADCAWPAIRRLLRVTPNLVELNLSGIPLVDSAHGSSTDNLRLPSLRRVSFHCPTDDLMRLSTQLEYLSLCTESTSVDQFRSLLEQSPDLKWLRVEESTWSPGELRHMPLTQVMTLVPVLTHIEIWSFERETAEVLFALLAESTPGSSRILPHLQSLEIRPLNAPPSASSLEVLLAALYGRRDSLRTVRIEMSTSVALPRFVVSPDTLASMRQLVAEGMDVYIGLFLGKQNFLSAS